MPSERFARLIALMAVLLVGSLGCSSENMVTLKISGTSTKAQRDQISEKAEALTDGSSHFITSYQMNDTYTVNVGPVMDVKGFVKQIDFGKVAKVEDRTIYIEFSTKPVAEVPAPVDPAAPSEEQ